MTESFVTQCPHCRTSFRVDLAQLGAAHGAVRCGACLHVFNAARQLLAQGQALPETTRPTPAAPAQAPAAGTPSAAHGVEPAAPPSPTQKPSEDTLWIHDDLDLDSLDLDEELAKLEQQEQQLSQQFLSLEQAPETVEAFHAPTEAERQAHDEQWAEALLREDGPRRPLSVEPAALDEPPQASRTTTPPAQASRSEPTLNLSEADADDLRPRARRAKNIGDLSAALDEFDGEPPAAPAPPPTANATRSEPKLRDEQLFELDDEPLQLDWRRPRHPWGRRLAWSLLALLAAATLGGQYVAYHLDELARQDRYRPWFERLCPTIGCSLPSKVDIAQIRSSNLVVRSHPEFSGALVVDAILYNRAPFAQPFPLLEMRFADLNGQLLASRRFKPSEYLAGELAGQAEMPPQTPIHVSLDILDPGTQAVNYSLSFHSPE